MSGAGGPRVTVCIPTFNRSALLARTLESVLAQTYVDWVVEIADNASTDDTADVVAALADPRIRYRRNPENVGAARNFNILAARAETEYVLFLCDDDLMHPEMLEEAVAALDAHPNVGFVHTAFDVVDADGRLIQTTNWTYGPNEDTLETARMFMTESMRWSCRVCASTAVIRRSAIPPGGFDESTYPAIDFHLWLEMTHAGWDVAFLARPLASYRIHEGSESAQALGQIQGSGYGFQQSEVTRVQELKLRFLERHADELDGVPALRKLVDRCAHRETLAGVKRETLDRCVRFRHARFVAGAARVDRRSLVSALTWGTLLADVVHGRRPECPQPAEPQEGMLAR